MVDEDSALSDLAPGDILGREMGMEKGGTSNGGTAGTLLATGVPWPPEDRGREGLGLDLRKDDDRTPAGKDATGRRSALRERLPAVRGRPLPSTEGRGPSFTLALYPARSRSRTEGRADCEDWRGSDGA